MLLVPAGKIGIARSANVTSAILERFQPRNVVVIGIAGSLSSNLQPGDVFIPDSVNEYLANSATVGINKWSFQTSGNQSITDPRLLNRFQFLPSTHEKLYRDWRRKALARFRKVINQGTLEKLKDSEFKCILNLNCMLVMIEFWQAVQQLVRPKEQGLDRDEHLLAKMVKN